jgi:hypothetical protein
MGARVFEIDFLPAGVMLELCWIYAGFMLDLCWIYAGFMSCVVCRPNGYIQSLIM